MEFRDKCSKIKHKCFLHLFIIDFIWQRHNYCSIRQKGFVHNRSHTERANFCSIPRFMTKRCLSEKMNARDCWKPRNFDDFSKSFTFYFGGIFWKIAICSKNCKIISFPHLWSKMNGIYPWMKIITKSSKFLVFSNPWRSFFLRGISWPWTLELSKKIALSV